jgi:hypothetical protein
MRLLALGCALALLMTGCLSGSQNLSPTGPPAPGLPAVVVHRAGAVLPVSAEQLLGTAPAVVEKLLGTRGGEPNIGVTSKGSIFITSGDFVMKSTDKGDTWTRSYEFGNVHNNATPQTRDPVRNSDPMLWVDPVTDRVFAPFMWPTLLCAEGVWSDDDGATWFDRPMDCGLPVNDHQKLATGPYTMDSPLLPLKGSYPNVVYFCYNKLVSTNCAVSTDGGLSFPLDNVVTMDCGGINGHPTAAPNGTVFIGLSEGCADTYVARSFDNGMSWELLKLHTDGLGQAEADPEVAVTPDGTSYYFWRATEDHRVYVVRSADAFSSITKPFLVSPPDVTSTRFVAMDAGDDGKLAFAYLGTRDSDARAGEVNDLARWHLFMTFTTDAEAAEPTFTTVQVTPADDPVQVGYQWESGGGDPGRNLLDFIDLVIAKDGRAYAAFTDGCTKDCAGSATATKFQSRARDTALAVMLAGPVLRAAEAAAAKAPGGAPPALPALPVAPPSVATSR